MTYHGLNGVGDAEAEMLPYLICIIDFCKKHLRLDSIMTFIVKGSKILKLGVFWHEPRHDKTNNVAVRPAKTQISLGIRPVWSETSLCT